MFYEVEIDQRGHRTALLATQREYEAARVDPRSLPASEDLIWRAIIAEGIGGWWVTGYRDTHALETGQFLLAASVVVEHDTAEVRALMLRRRCPSF